MQMVDGAIIWGTMTMKEGWMGDRNDGDRFSHGTHWRTSSRQMILFFPHPNLPSLCPPGLHRRDCGRGLPGHDPAARLHCASRGYQEAQAQVLRPGPLSPTIRHAGLPKIENLSRGGLAGAKRSRSREEEGLDWRRMVQGRLRVGRMEPEESADESGGRMRNPPMSPEVGGLFADGRFR